MLHESFIPYYLKIIPADIDKTGGLPNELVVFVGAKVISWTNINVRNDLIDGAIRRITEIIWPHFRRDQMYDTDILAVKIDFDNSGIHLIQLQSI